VEMIGRVGKKKLFRKRKKDPEVLNGKLIKVLIANVLKMYLFQILTVLIQEKAIKKSEMKELFELELIVQVAPLKKFPIRPIVNIFLEEWNMKIMVQMHVPTHGIQVIE